MSAPFTTREAWLQAFTEAARPKFTEVGAPLPVSIRMAIGFCSTGRKGKRIGECWSAESSADGACEIFIVPSIDNPITVAEILTHELVHAAVGCKHGHNKVFGRPARALGLEGKLTATYGGKGWAEWALPIVKALGPLPHAALSSGVSSGPKKQTNRMVKCVCGGCGFVFRTARSYIEAAGGVLGCPDPSCGGEALPC